MAAALQDPCGRTARVVIIGAGVAGLQCARILRQVYGVQDTVIVEAADYVGGCAGLLRSETPCG